MVALMSTFTVTAERTAKWWVLQAVEAPGAISQVARLDQVAQIKEALAFVTGESEEDIEIDVRLSLPAAAEVAHRLAVERRAEAAQANREAAYYARLTARELASSGLSVRDIGTILGVSYQRAHQLVTAELDPPETLSVPQSAKADSALA
ncbi:hypothetical protein ABH923_002669 [Leifsonia sp. EB41]|jgi:hypothetical protein|uniref:hypothetical protein n=1 Tax=Leifsonia sp. EB41 TaxID=3156260 RepID=UPI0035140F44